MKRKEWTAEEEEKLREWKKRKSPAVNGSRGT